MKGGGTQFSIYTNKSNNSSTRTISVDIEKLKTGNQIGSQSESSSQSYEVSTDVTGRLPSNIQSEQNKKQQDNCFNSRINLKHGNGVQVMSKGGGAVATQAEDFIQDQEESKGVLTHSFQTKRNSLCRDKENLIIDDVNWKQKYLELQTAFSHKNKQHFIQERTISELQIQLQNERNKARFYERNHEQLSGLKKELDDDRLKRRQTEDKLAQSQQQNEILLNQISFIFSTSTQKTPAQQLNNHIKYTSSATSSPSNASSLKKKSLDSRLPVDKSKRSKQSLNSFDNMPTDNSHQIKILQGNELYISAQRNKTLLLKVSELEKELLSLKDNLIEKDKKIEHLKLENKHLGEKMLECTQIINSLGQIQSSEEDREKFLNPINSSKFHLKEIPYTIEQNHNQFTQFRNVGEMAKQKNDHSESISDQSIITYKLTNQSIFKFEQEALASQKQSGFQKQILSQQQQPEVREIQRNNNPIQPPSKLLNFQSLQKQKEYFYSDEIQFVQESGENTMRLCKLCSC